MRFTLRLLNSIFIVVYTTGVVIGVYDFFSENSFKEIQFEDAYVLILFIVYLAGFILSWKREYLAGSIILAWLVLLWTGTGFVFSASDGMELVLGVPALPLGILFLLLGFRGKREEKADVHQEWIFCLRILSNLYLILYVVFAISELVRGGEYNLFAYPDILLLGLFLVFLAGYIFHTTLAHITGFIFIGWYIMLILVSALIPEIGGDGYLGLYAAIGSVILVQGCLYINYWYRLKPKQA